MAQASVEKQEQTGPAEKGRVASLPQREQLASTPKPPLPKGKGAEVLKDRILVAKAALSNKTSYSSRYQISQLLLTCFRN